MLTKQLKKEWNSSKINIYKSIPDVDDRYINRVLIESCPINVLERILFKEDTSKILKFAKAQLKINAKNYTKDQVKELGILYLNDDKNKKLYNTISNENIASVNKIFSLKFAKNQITLDIFNDEDEFIKSINILLSEINVFLLVSYIRAKHDNLFNTIPYILKEFEDSNVYISSGMKDAGYKINFEEKFSQKYGFKLEFEEDYNEKDNKQGVSLNMTETKISTNINNIIGELQNISNIFETLETDKSKIEVLEKDLKENKKLLRKANNQISKNENEIQGLKEELDKYTSELEDKKTSIDNLHDTIKSKVEKETDLKIQITQLNKSIKDIESRYNKQLKNIQKDLDESLQKESDLNCICDNLKNKLNIASDSLKQTLDTNKNLEDENEALKLKIRELEEKINNRDLSANKNVNDDDSTMKENSIDDGAWDDITTGILDYGPSW